MQTPEITPASHWNYRIILIEGMYQVHEVYYKNGKINGWTKNPIKIISEDLDGIKFALDEIQLAFEKPVLEYANGQITNV